MHLLQALKPSSVSEDTDQSLIQLFEIQVRRAPGTTAVVFQEEQLSFGELNARSNRLARLLRARGGTPGVLVGVRLQRSTELLIALLGILKAGGAYVPIDPTLPAERLISILDDTRIPLLLTHSDLQESLPEHSSKTICLDLVDETLNLQRSEDLTHRTTASDTAYVIYTSGSTGQPKGVLVPHGALANYLSWARDQYSDRPRQSYPLFTFLAFDFTITSLFVPLIAGGTIYVYPEKKEVMDSSILDVIAANEVDVVKLTPAHLGMIKDLDLKDSKVTTLILGGEDLRQDLAREAVRAFGGKVRIFNEYGPTEATVGCMIHRFDADQEFNTSVPIGRPIDNVHVYLLDGNQNLVPQGVIGEIYLAGDGLADGFLGQPSRTAKLFLPDPFGNGTRMYRTGDLGRLDPEGNVVYLGRIDDQVKIRGVRIERGEVETALRRHPAIRACVVGVDQYESTQLGRNLKHCRRCGLPSNYPEVGFDENGVCQLCSSYETYREKAQQYFRSPEDLRALFTNSRRSGSNGYDCIMLFSGGKDSTYALYQLVAMDLKILAFTLDNGYISDEAKANIRRVVDELRIDHVFGGTTAMPKIFVDSLRRHSNVCHGCFKTIYTLSTKLARDKGIRFIVTGLSRGRFFETRLTQELFEGDKVDSDRIDEFILAARKAYHQVDDEVSRIPEASVFQSEQIFQDVQFVDFYRYCDVGMDEVLEFLNRRAPWIRPSDTGRSTNYLINDVGIHIHKRQRGYHNYALPYSWDVRVGHKNREAALDELSDQINVTSVRKILAEIGYRDDIDVGQAENRLVAYYVSDTSLPASELRTFLSRILPVSMLPSYFVRLEDIPLSSSGKVDWRALPRPEGRLRDLETTFVPPRNDVEQRLAKIWAKVLRVEQVGVTDNFFDLGGDSIMALQIIARALESGLRLLPNQLFQKQTIAELAAAAGTSDSAPAEQGLVTGSVPLTPVQHRFFEQVLPEPHHWNQSLLLEISRPLDQILLEKALQQLLRHHDALRLRFSQEDTTWQQINQDYSAPEPIVRFDLSGIPSDQQDRAIEEAEKELQSSLNLSQGPLIRLAIFELGTDRPDRLLLILHHLIVDGVSWLILLEDLETLYEQLSRDNPVALPPKSMSFKAWSETLTSYADREDLKEEINYWIGRPYREAGKLPLDKGPRGANLEGSALDLFVSLAACRT